MKLWYISEVVVEYLKYEGYDNTAYGGDKSDLHTRCNDCWRNITSLNDVVECLDHTDGGAKESEGWCHSDEEGNPREVGLELAALESAVRSDGGINLLK